MSGNDNNNQGVNDNRLNNSINNINDKNNDEQLNRSHHQNNPNYRHPPSIYSLQQNSKSSNNLNSYLSGYSNNSGNINTGNNNNNATSNNQSQHQQHGSSGCCCIVQHKKTNRFFDSIFFYLIRPFLIGTSGAVGISFASEYSFADDLPNQISLMGVYRDLTPDTNPDFEIDNPNHVIKGLVKPILGADRKPVYCCGSNPAPSKDQYVIHSDKSFHSWFHDSPGINIPIVYPLTMVRNASAEDPRIYSFTEDNFFPIDGKGFDDPKLYPNRKIYRDSKGTPHNFHFCLELHATFTYVGGEVFRFRGDDDVWVYINNKMVVDLGAPHDIVGNNGYGEVALDTLGLTLMNDYPFDFFYCERHTTESHIMISTSIRLNCTYKDYCGVCEGDGSSCCNTKVCDDGDLCTDDICPPPKTPLPIGTLVSDICIHKRKVCNQTICESYGCDKKTGNCIQFYDPTKECGYTDYCHEQVCKNDLGGCIQLNRTCEDPLKNPSCFIPICTNASCDYNPIPCDDNNKCTKDECKPGIGCTFTKIPCDDNDHCTKDECTPSGGCTHTQIENCVSCPNASCITTDKCKPQECSPTNAAECQTKPVICDDGNLCTVDSCSNGDCVFTPKNCVSDDACYISKCNQKTGECDRTYKNCDDGIVCTIDSCANGTCVNALNPCDDGDACTLDSCNNKEGGCVHTPINCTDTVCGIASCDKKLGCVYAPRVCPTTDFCINSKCDVMAGGCIYYPKICKPDRPDCEIGVCNNVSNVCTNKQFDPLPFKCQSTAVKAGVAVGAAAIAGIVIGGAAALGLAIFGGKKGYDAWKNMKQAKMAVSAENPLYVPNPNQGTNPLYNNNST
eukprot:gene5791-7203_t